MCVDLRGGGASLTQFFTVEQMGGTVAAKKKSARGRPPTPPERLRRQQFTVMLTDGEREALNQRAAEEDLPAGTIARRILSAALLPKRRAKR